MLLTSEYALDVNYPMTNEWYTNCNLRQRIAHKILKENQDNICSPVCFILILISQCGVDGSVASLQVIHIMRTLGMNPLEAEIQVRWMNNIR